MIWDWQLDWIVDGKGSDVVGWVDGQLDWIVDGKAWTGMLLAALPMAVGQWGGDRNMTDI